MVWQRRRVRELEHALNEAIQGMELACWALNKAQGLVGVDDDDQVVEWLGDAKVDLGRTRDDARELLGE